MDSQVEYENRMRAEAMKKVTKVERAPLADRKEAQREFAEALKAPDLIAERLGWLIDGNYGYGEMMRAKQVLKSPRMNREAALVQMVACYEWLCPQRGAMEAWKKLTAPEKKMLSRAVEIVISEAEKEE